MILDTDILSAIVSPRCPDRVKRELVAAEGDVFTTSVSWAEICYGLAKHRAGARLRKHYQEMVLPAVTILPFDGPCAEVYGLLRSELENQHRRLAEADLMIASVALRHDLPLVSGNVRHFSRVPGLVVVNWFEE